jgi:hypothetical protein
VITTNRNVFFGLHVTRAVKVAIQKEVKRLREDSKEGMEYTISGSSVGYDLLKQALIERGYGELQNDEVG